MLRRGYIASAILATVWPGVALAGPAPDKAAYDCSLTWIGMPIGETKYVTYLNGKIISWRLQKFSTGPRTAICAINDSSVPTPLSEFDYHALMSELQQRQSESAPADSSPGIPLNVLPQISPQTMPRLVPGGPVNGTPNTGQLTTPLQPPPATPSIPQAQPGQKPHGTLEPQVDDNNALVNWSLDNRIQLNTQVFPDNTITYLLITWPNGTQASCSGTLVSPNLVLTAGHCVYDPTNGGAATSITVSLAQYTSGGLLHYPYGQAAGSSTIRLNFFSTNFTGGTISSIVAPYDAAAVLLAAKFSTSSFMPIAFSHTGTGANNAGYPGYVKDVSNLDMFGAFAGTDYQVAPGRKDYPLFCSAGDSGGPFWWYDGVTSSLIGNLSYSLNTIGAAQIYCGGPFYDSILQSSINGWMSQAAATVASLPTVQIPEPVLALVSPAPTPPTAAVGGPPITIDLATYVAGGTAPLKLSGLSSASAFGASLQASGTIVTYTPTANEKQGNDFFVVLVEDSSTPQQLVAVLPNVTVSGVLPQSGWWWNAAEPGRGYAFEIAHNSIYFAAYMYRSDGTPVWYIGTGTITNGVYSGSLYEYAGAETIASGPPANSAPLSNPAVNITLSFSTPTTGSISWVGGVVGTTAVSTPIVRYPFAGTTVIASSLINSPQTGWWWNSNEPGTGYFIEEQSNQIFMAAYVYGSDSRDLWYYAQGAAMNTQGGLFETYVQSSANLSEALHGQTLTSGPMSPTATSNAGSVALKFDSSTSGTLTLPSGRQISLSRFSF